MSDADRFWSKVDMSGECWTWAAFSVEGYGRFSVKGHRVILAHRWSYAEAHDLALSDLPKVVRHTCDNPSCVNPAHLLGGTVQDNNRDRVARDRSATGLSNGKARLSRDDVLKIRERLSTGERNLDIASDFGVAPCTISNIKRNHRRQR